jgi:hypothetical protein
MKVKQGAMTFVQWVFRTVRNFREISLDFLGGRCPAQKYGTYHFIRTIEIIDISQRRTSHHRNQ